MLHTDAHGTCTCHPKLPATILMNLAATVAKNHRTVASPPGARDIHNHQAALAYEATRGWWINQGGRYSCQAIPGKNIHHPGLSTSPGWPHKQGPPAGGGYLSLPYPRSAPGLAWPDQPPSQVRSRTVFLLCELGSGLGPAPQPPEWIGRSRPRAAQRKDLGFGRVDGQTQYTGSHRLGKLC